MKKRISYLGVCNNITQTACDIDFSSFDTVLLILVKSGTIFASTLCIPIKGVSMFDIRGKYSGVEYEGIAWTSGQKITSLIVSDNSVAMHMYGIKY